MEGQVPRLALPDREGFEREHVPAQEPVVFGLPAGEPGLGRWLGHGPLELLRAWARPAGHRVVRVASLPAAEQGRLSHRDAAGRVPNWEERRMAFSGFVDALGRLLERPTGAVLALQSVPLREDLPELAAGIRHPLVPGVPGRLWAGPRMRGDTHYDQHHNLACVLAGRKRFLLFPPDCLPDLYPSPFEGTHVGAPLSLVDPLAPDLVRHPRFAAALARARTVELGPGDVLFLPAYWWHHVETLEPAVMVNFWWSDLSAREAAAASACFWHALRVLRELPAPHRQLFARLFDCFVFERDGPPYAHLPESEQGVAGTPTPGRRGQLAARARAGLRALETDAPAPAAGDPGQRPAELEVRTAGRSAS